MPASNQKIEASLADLAITAVGDKLPGLLEYLQGFEVVAGSANDEGSRAAGLLGFNIGGSQVMMPVLFLNGKLKGMECLYLCDSDTFVSASPEWVEYLTSRNSGNTGEPSEHGNEVQGVPQSALRIFNRPPRISGSKFASIEDRDAMWVEFMNPRRALAAPSPNFTVPNALRAIGKTACHRFMRRMVTHHPELLVKMAEFYPGDALKIQFPEEPKATTVKTAAPVQKLAFVTLDQVYATPGDFTDEQKQAAFRGELVVLDKRAKEEKSSVFDSDYASKFSTPIDSGFYSMINGDGELKDVFIARNAFLLDRPGKSVAGCIIINPSSGQYYLPITGEEVLVRSKKQLSDADFEKEFKKLTKIESAATNKTYVAISPKGLVSAPFKVRSKEKTPDYDQMRVETVYTFESRVMSQDHSRSKYTSDCSPCSPGGSYISGTTVRIIDAPVGKVTKLGDLICVPSDWKIMEVNDGNDAMSGLNLCGSSDDYEKKRNAADKKRLELRPGSAEVLSQAINDKAIHFLQMEKKGQDYTILVGGRNGKCSPRLRKNAALSTLVGKLGFDLKDASDLMDRTAEGGGGQVWFKLADQYNGMPFPELDDRNGVNDLGLPETERVHEQMEVPFQRDEKPPFDPDGTDFGSTQKKDVDFLSRAADANAKNVFDSGMIGMILKSNRTEAQIDDWLPDLVKAEDSKIRMMLSFYWRNSAWAQQFGKDDLAEFEDLLLSGIKNDGETVLFLKQRAGQDPGSKTDALGE